jgi:hypothetical protein
MSEAPDPGDHRNAVERAKAALDPLDLRPRIERYARQGYASIDPRYQVADVGLAGGESAGDGNFQLHLGGDLGQGKAFGHRVRERVLAAEAEEVVGGLLGAYLAGRREGERLQAWLRRQPAETLAALSRAPVVAAAPA